MQEILGRSKVPLEDTWDLSRLFNTEKEFEQKLDEFSKAIPQIEKFKGVLGQSEKRLAEALNYIIKKLYLLNERLGYYVDLRQSEDVSNCRIQHLHGRYMALSTEFSDATSWFLPEIQSIPEQSIKQFMRDSDLADYRIFLSRLIRLRAHTLSAAEESIIAQQGESSQTASTAFSALTNADMEFGTVSTDAGEIVLTNSSFSTLLKNQNRQIRQAAYKKFYAVFNSHRNTLSALHTGSVLKNKYEAKIRSYNSALEMALFQDNVSMDVYDNLISTVRKNLPALHNYYSLRAECLNLKNDLRHWDLHCPLVEIQEQHHNWNQAVELVCSAMQPLGDEYTDILHRGLTGRWVDKYENKGKRSGAFSAGSYTSDPYILMNFQDNDLRDVFTLAHEAGHSMHSWYSVNNNPFPHYNYSIFEAEVASTFNEQLLSARLLEQNLNKKMRAYLISNQMNNIVATIYRQTMFAEFERETHHMVENGGALTIDGIREIYRKLLQDYFGSALILEKYSDLECLRIPHFYNSFYVYKYSTGLSAAISLANMVLQGSQKEQQQYLDFLKLGGSLFPIESLKRAGVDMSNSKPIQDALDAFASMTDQFKQCLEP